MAKLNKEYPSKKIEKSNTSSLKKWTRRGFIGAGAIAGITAGGALIVGIAIRPGDRTEDLSGYVTNGDEHLITTWVKVATDNTVTAIIPHGEMGQGVHTALSAMLAEEMEADWGAMEIMEAPAEKDYANFALAREFLFGSANVPSVLFDSLNGAMLAAAKSMNMQITGGSTSVRFTGTGAMLTAGAAAKELLLSAAAKKWGVPITQLRAEKSFIYHNNKKAPFSEFAEIAATLKPNLQPKLKKRNEYKLIGKSLPRVDIPAKVDGTAIFGIDAQIEGMKYGTVKAAPVHGQKVSEMDDSIAKKMPGVYGVYNMEDYIAVVADGYWHAKNALDFIDVTWTSSSIKNIDDKVIFDNYRSAIKSGKGKLLHKFGNVEKSINESASIHEAEYSVPLLAHACMEPMNATAWYRDGKCDIWAGTQNPLGTRQVTADTLGIELESVTVHTAFMGGGFGRRANPDYTNQAAQVSKKSGVPVKLIWSREETTQQDFYRPSVLGHLKAGLDIKGLPISWESKFVHNMDPHEASAVIYDIPNIKAQYMESPTHIRIGAWRSVDHTQHGYFTESFIDELASNAGIDSYEFRRLLLKTKPRHLNVLDTAARMAGWGKTLPPGYAQGIAIVESFMSIVAQVVTVDISNGAPRVVNVACAADAGMAINPNGFIAQMESGIIFGLTAALYGEITISNGSVDQSNFYDYKMVRMDDAPSIDVEIISSNNRIGGAGEPGTPPIAPALVNAIYKASGQRIRSLPIGNQRFSIKA